MAGGFTRTPFKPGWQGRPKPGTTKSAMVPAPGLGINATVPLATMEPQFCVNSVNLIPNGIGMRVRSGYSSFATDVDVDGIRTVLPFDGASANKLFAVGPNGIYDVTAGGAGPWVPEVALSGAPLAGWGMWTNFVSDAGSHYAFYADEADGLYRRQEGGTWAAVTDITGVSELNLVSVTQHQSRLWFVERGTASGWYLASGAISGAATKFNFGNKFRHGGFLVGLYPWTVDGGQGMDDHLVAISSGGDVMVYKGTDPSSATTWELVGQFYVGQLPVGRRVANNETGDLFILSQYGVIPLTRLMQGQLIQQEATQLSKNIAPIIADAMALTIDTRGWELRNVPGENVFLLARPNVTGFEHTQYALSTRTYGWTVFEGLPYQTGDVFEGGFYFGDDTGTLWLFDGNTDNDEAIAWSMVSAFSEAGEVGRYHRVHFMRPVFLAGGLPDASVEARFDYDLDLPVPISSNPPISGALWDVAVWDTAFWAGAGLVIQSVVGGAGIGRAMGIALSGTSETETTLLRIDMLYDTGGML